jgi:hypothetical protein
MSELTERTGGRGSYSGLTPNRARPIPNTGVWLKQSSARTPMKTFLELLVAFTKRISIGVKSSDHIAILLF